MKYLMILPILLAVVCLSPTPTSAADPEPKILQTIVYKPENCTVKAEKEDVLETDYVGYFRDGKKFDSTYDRSARMKFTLGYGEVIKGAEQDALGMCVGEIHHTEIPSQLAYGSEPYGGIPPNSTLVFDTTLVVLKKTPKVVMPMGINFGAMFGR